MAHLIDQAVVLRCWEFSESSQTVALMTRRSGRLKGLAKGSRRPTGTFGGGLDPLTRGEIVAIVKPGVELATLTEWDLQEVFWGPRRGLLAHRAGAYFADLVLHAVIDEDPHPALFEALVDELRALEDPGACWEAALRFQWRLLVEIGSQPRLDAGGGAPAGAREFAFAPGEGVVGPGAPGPSWRVRAATIGVLRDLERDPSGFRTSGTEQDTVRAGRLLAEYLRVHIDRELGTKRMLFGASEGGGR